MFFIDNRNTDHVKNNVGLHVIGVKVRPSNPQTNNKYSPRIARAFTHYSTVCNFYWSFFTPLNNS